MAERGRQELQIAWKRTWRMESRTLNLYAGFSCKPNPYLKSFTDHNNFYYYAFHRVVLFWSLYEMFATINILFICLVRVLLFIYSIFAQWKILVENSFVLPPIYRASFVGESRRKVKSLVTPAWGYRKKWRTVGRHSCQVPRCNFHDAIKFCKKLRKKAPSFYALIFPAFYLSVFYFFESIIIR